VQVMNYKLGHEYKNLISQGVGSVANNVDSGWQRSDKLL
jgi:hypothetical protein